MHNPTHSPRVWPVILVAVAVLVLARTGHWLLAERLARPPQSAPLPPGTLARLPLRIGDWAGYDRPLDAALVAATATDDHLYRIYQRHAGTQSVGLYIAYGIKGRDLMPHRPEVCYPGAGWTARGSDRLALALPDGGNLVCTLYEFSQSGLSSQTMYVLNYYIVDGRYAPDVSLLRSKAWRGASGARYMAQVQVTCSGGALLNRDAALEAIRQFAAASIPPIRALLPDAQPQAAATGRLPAVAAAGLASARLGGEP